MQKHHTFFHFDKQGHYQMQSLTLSTLRLLTPGIRPIVPAVVSSGGKTAEVLLLQDTGSSVSSITIKNAKC